MVIKCCFGLVLVVTLAAAGRLRIFESTVESQGWWSTDEASHADLVSFLIGEENEYTGKTGMVTLAVKVVVPPREIEEFVREWRRLHDKTVEEKGNIFYGMEKPATDNTVFIIYGEWCCFGALRKHMTSEYVGEFFRFVGDRGIALFLKPLRPIHGHNGAFKHDNDSNHGSIAVLVNYVVDPGCHKDFIEEWERVADKTSKEKGNMEYNLQKVMTDNLQFWGYGAWESWEDLFRHFHSDYSQAFRKYIMDKNVITFSSPLVRIPGRKDRGGDTFDF